MRTEKSMIWKACRSVASRSAEQPWSRKYLISFITHLESCSTHRKSITRYNRILALFITTCACVTFAVRITRLLITVRIPWEEIACVKRYTYCRARLTILLYESHYQLCVQIQQAWQYFFLRLAQCKLLQAVRVLFHYTSSNGRISSMFDAIRLWL